MKAEKIQALMSENPRKTSREYAEMAIAQGLADDIDGDELRVREVQKSVRQIASDSKSDPQFAFVSVSKKDGEDVYAPAPVCTKVEAQQVLDNYSSKIEGTVRRASQLCDYWNAKPFNYQLRFNWG